MRILNYILVLVLYLSNLCYAQEEQSILGRDKFKFEKFSSDKGLKHHSLTSIYQDSKGYMWFGAYNGIYKYDGYTFKIYKNILEDFKTPSENLITAIYEDSWGTIWVGTMGGLLCYNRDYDSFTEKIKIEGSVDENPVINNRINCIFQDKNQVLWIGTEKGLYQLIKSSTDKQLFEIKHFVSSDDKK